MEAIHHHIVWALRTAATAARCVLSADTCANHQAQFDREVADNRSLARPGRACIRRTGWLMSHWRCDRQRAGRRLIARHVIVPTTGAAEPAGSPRPSDDPSA
jgi:hypothetical protein